jgi:hypothetical protein
MASIVSRGSVVDNVVLDNILMKFSIFPNKPDTSKTYLLYFMLHACLYTICFVFCYTLWCFYAFSRTNLLTRCQSASSLFSAVFVFQKSYIGNILRIGQSKSQTCYFFQSVTKSEDETEGCQRPGSP